MNGNALLQKANFIVTCYGLGGKTWWRHQMETFFGLLALCARNSPITGEFFAQRPVTPWINNREAGYLRRHRAHYDVTVIELPWEFISRSDQSSASLAFGWAINRWPVNSPHKWPLTLKLFTFGDVIMGFHKPPDIICHIDQLQL